MQAQVTQDINVTFILTPTQYPWATQTQPTAPAPGQPSSLTLAAGECGHRQDAILEVGTSQDFDETPAERLNRLLKLFELPLEDRMKAAAKERRLTSPSRPTVLPGQGDQGSAPQSANKP